MAENTVSLFNSRYYFMSYGYTFLSVFRSRYTVIMRTIRRARYMMNNIIIFIEIDKLVGRLVFLPNISPFII
jgi:hypothetical protein